MKIIKIKIKYFPKTGELIAFCCCKSLYELLRVFRSGGNELSINDPAVAFVGFFGEFPHHRHLQIKFSFLQVFVLGSLIS